MSDSVCSWLEDLRTMTDTECMCVLQGKSLAKDTNDIFMTAARTPKGIKNTVFLNKGLGCVSHADLLLYSKCVFLTIKLNADSVEKDTFI